MTFNYKNEKTLYFKFLKMILNYNNEETLYVIFLYVRFFFICYILNFFKTILNYKTVSFS